MSTEPTPVPGDLDPGPFYDAPIPQRIATEARERAAQAWCDKETAHLVMQPELAEAFARRLAPLLNEIDKLGNFIMREIPGEPSQNEGAADTAIRLLRRLRSAESALHDMAAYKTKLEAGVGRLRGQAPGPDLGPWSASNPCPWCKSCGLPAQYHKEGSYTTGSDGALCTAFVPWEYAAAPGESPAPAPAPARLLDDPRIAAVVKNVEEWEADDSRGPGESFDLLMQFMQAVRDDEAPAGEEGKDAPAPLLHEFSKLRDSYMLGIAANHLRSAKQLHKMGCSPMENPCTCGVEEYNKTLHYLAHRLECLVNRVWKLDYPGRHVEASEARGTYACPHCGKDTPHHHAVDRQGKLLDAPSSAPSPDLREAATMPIPTMSAG